MVFGETMWVLWGRVVDGVVREGVGEREGNMASRKAKLRAKEGEWLGKEGLLRFGGEVRKNWCSRPTRIGRSRLWYR